MVDVVVRGFLGGPGVALLDFYLAQSLWINGLLILYVALVAIGRRNYRLLRRCLLTQLELELGGNQQTRRQIERRLGKMELPWDTVLAASRFPLVALPSGWLLRPKNRRTLQAFFTPQKLTELLAGA